MFKKSPRLSVFMFVVVWSAVLWPTEIFALDPEEFQVAFIEQLKYGPAQSLGVEGHGLGREDFDRRLSQVYHQNGLQPLWITADGPGKRAAGILEALTAANNHGLSPNSYLANKIREHWTRTDAVGLARLDILLSLGLRGYVADLREGRIDPRKLDPKLFATARDAEIDWKVLREQAFAAADMKAFLDDQVPPFPQYRKLQKALIQYRKIKERGGWEAIPEGETLKPGMEDERLKLIRKRLSITDGLKSDTPEGTTYNDEVVEAVKRFQFRHGLESDGVIGKETLAAMNVSANRRIGQILINMERYRWLTREPIEKVIVVNIAGFRVAGMKPKEGLIEIEMPVIVGKEYHKTPVFSDSIKYVEFNPYWNLPPSIAKNEMLPKLKKNPRYLKERNIRVFDGWGEEAKELDSVALDWKSMRKKDIARYRLRQDPGPKNALGTVKFIFPNAFNVYLHDTPSHSLFQRTKRAFSHGCIRVSRPAELASYILGGEENGWGIERAKETIATGGRKVVVLQKPLPIYILYRTVVIGPEDDKVYFRQDVYGRDALLEKALFEH
jgi:murein L,D-transpeptidase YcbB/YkuD